MRAPGLTGKGPQNSWDWYFTMQHFGAPARLLDWTEGVLIALYFVVKDSSGEDDPAIWALDPWWLNKPVVGNAKSYRLERGLAFQNTMQIATVRGCRTDLYPSNYLNSLSACSRLTAPGGSVHRDRALRSMVPTRRDSTTFVTKVMRISQRSWFLAPK
jgi:FRG domain